MKKELLHWSELLDEDDNSYWETPSPYCVDGDPVIFRIRQRLQDNRREYYDDSDEEFTRDGVWESLEEAQGYFEDLYYDIVNNWCS